MKIWIAVLVAAAALILSAFAAPSLLPVLFPLIMAFAVTALIAPAFIPWLHKLKFGQEIREEGPSWHQKKSGTPTMGGIMFIVGIAVAVIGSFIICAVTGNMNTTTAKILLMFGIALGFGIIGFIDDYIKVVKKRNLGLKAGQKFALQIFLSVIYIVVLYFMNELNTEIQIPFTDISWEMPMWLYIPFVLFVVTGTVNAVNLTDGLDGLAASVTIIVSLFFAVLARSMNETGISDFGIAVAGGLAAFLIYNKYPAKVFMGDTGSLFLGAAVVVMAVGLGMPLFLIIAGFVYFMETLSVIIQVTSFKLTGKRVFKMSPIHHHFEMCGWNEKKIVAVFCVITLIMCVIAVGGFYIG